MVKEKRVCSVIAAQPCAKAALKGTALGALVARLCRAKIRSHANAANRSATTALRGTALGVLVARHCRAKIRSHPPTTATKENLSSEKTHIRDFVSLWPLSNAV